MGVLKKIGESIWLCLRAKGVESLHTCSKNAFRAQNQYAALAKSQLSA